MREIKGYEGLYAVTEDGKVWSYKREKFLSPGGKKGEYQIVCLSKDGKSESKYVHRLVAQAWIPNPDNLPEVNHKDQNKDNNCVENLEWCDRAYNLNYGTRKDKIMKPVYCFELDKTFLSIADASKKLNLAASNLCNHVKYNKPKHVGGYHFRYEVN